MSVDGRSTSPGGWYGPTAFHDVVLLSSVFASPNRSCRAFGVSESSMRGSRVSSLVRCDCDCAPGRGIWTVPARGRFRHDDAAVRFSSDDHVGYLLRFSSSLGRFTCGLTGPGFADFERSDLDAGRAVRKYIDDVWAEDPSEGPERAGQRPLEAGELPPYDSDAT